MRYLVFAFDIDRPQGGMNDLLCKTADLEDAIETAENFVKNDIAVNCAEVYDTQTGTTVYERG